MKKIETEVCIVGAGPVGLTMAMELASRGTRALIIERNSATGFSNPKASHVGARSMELFRRHGIASEIRAQGLPDDYPNDAVYATRFTGFEITRFRMPCRTERFNDADYVDGNLPSPERAARVSQMYLAPVILKRALAYETIEIMNATAFQTLTQNDDGVTVHARDCNGGEDYEIRCKYLLGADGGSSAVRKALGIELHGEDNLIRARSRMFRAPQLRGMCGYSTSWMHWFNVDGRWSSAIAINGVDLWLFHAFLPPSMEFESCDIDKSLREALGVGADFDYEIVTDEDWVGRRLVADKLQVGRCFIAGDAAHMWIPYGGYGMNAGIEDSANLAWKIDAVLKGWAPEAILRAYEAERLPVVDQTSRLAARFAKAVDPIDPAHLEEDTPEGEAFRARAGALLYKSHLPSMVPTGLNFGYNYAPSPLVAGDGATPPEYTMGVYTPTTVPGCRMPHFWLADGRSVHDVLGSGYTLVRLGGNLDTTALTDAAQQVGLPLTVADVEPGKDFDPNVFRERLLLIRPDQHIAWRGDQLPPDCRHLIDLVRGALIASSPAQTQSRGTAEGAAA